MIKLRTNKYIANIRNLQKQIKHSFTKAQQEEMTTSWSVKNQFIQLINKHLRAEKHNNFILLHYDLHSSVNRIDIVREQDVIVELKCKEKYSHSSYYGYKP